MRLRGLRDIKTHGTLARNGELISVARDLHQIGRSSMEERWGDWNVTKALFQKPLGRSGSRRDMLWDLAREKKVLASQIAAIKSLLEEFNQAIAEGLPVAIQEFERLKARLAELQAE